MIVRDIPLKCRKKKVPRPLIKGGTEERKNHIGIVKEEEKKKRKKERKSAAFREISKGRSITMLHIITAGRPQGSIAVKHRPIKGEGRGKLAIDRWSRNDEWEDFFLKKKNCS